jgi:hypothetical protein
MLEFYFRFATHNTLYSDQVNELIFRVATEMNTDRRLIIGLDYGTTFTSELT